MDKAASATGCRSWRHRPRRPGPPAPATRAPAPPAAKTRKGPTAARAFRLAQNRRQSDRVEKHQRENRVIGGAVPARQPQPDRMQDRFRDHDREEKSAQATDCPPAQVSRHHVVAAGRHRQKHHHDQEQQAAQVVPELAHPDQEASGRGQEQRVPSQAKPERPSCARPAHPRRTTFVSLRKPDQHSGCRTGCSSTRSEQTPAPGVQEEQGQVRARPLQALIAAPHRPLARIPANCA